MELWLSFPLHLRNLQIILGATIASIRQVSRGDQLDPDFADSITDTNRVKEGVTQGTNPYGNIRTESGRLDQRFRYMRHSMEISQQSTQSHALFVLKYVVVCVSPRSTKVDQTPWWPRLWWQQEVSWSPFKGSSNVSYVQNNHWAFSLPLKLYESTTWYTAGILVIRWDGKQVDLQR